MQLDVAQLDVAAALCRVKHTQLHAPVCAPRLKPRQLRPSVVCGFAPSQHTCGACVAPLSDSGPRCFHGIAKCCGSAASAHTGPFRKRESTGERPVARVVRYSFARAPASESVCRLRHRQARAAHARGGPSLSANVVPESQYAATNR